MTYPFAIFLAILLDQLLGDPPNQLHPTAWMGTLIYQLQRFRPHNNRAAELLYGFGILTLGVLLTAGTGFLLTLLAAQLPFGLGIIIHVLVLKLTISLRGLHSAAAQVQTALTQQNIPEARRLVSWHLVSRDTSQLDESKLSAATIESVAENASDGILAPLFFYALGGLPLALAYRFANTADSILGYRDPAREWLGKIPARFDDLLNLLPARLTGLCLLLAAPFCGANMRQGWYILWRDARQTASPNAGIPMSAMAGLLSCTLEKVGHYQLGKGLRLPQAQDITRARRLLWVATLLGTAMLSTWSFFVSPH